MSTPSDSSEDQALRTREAHAHAILDAALDAVITIDHLGRVLEFNRAAEQTFGYRKQHVLGQELAGLIVPPQYREAHRRALERWKNGETNGTGTMLGRRIEVEAMRSDGSVFPAELAISRVDVPGPPVFTASIRDLSEHEETWNRLRAAEFRYRTLVEQLPLISYVDPADSPVGQPLYISPQVETVFGYSPRDWLATPDLYARSIHEDDRERVLAEKAEAYELRGPWHAEYRVRARDGRVVWLEDRSVLVVPPEGGPPFRQGMAMDITERREAGDALRRAESRFRTLVEQLPLAVYVDRIDDESSNIYASPQIEQLLGYAREDWLGDPSLFAEVMHPDDREWVAAAHSRTYITREPLNIEYRLLAQDGRTVWVHDEARVVVDAADGEPVLQGYLLDVTARKAAEDELRHQAFHDPLTGLPNRALFTDRVRHALVIRGVEGGEAAVLYVDLDDFKAVNDTLGHSVADKLLQAVGARLRAALSAQHTVARIGGDEFAILVEGEDGASAAAEAAERLIAALHLPFDLDGREVFATASIGIALGDEAEDLMRSADAAMYRAKARGGSQYVVYAPGVDVDVVGRLELVADLRRARVEEEFVLHYQPIVELASGAIVGVEALVRWQHAELGLLAPSAFIPLAEETGRIVDIGRWVLSEACRQTARWRAELPGAKELSVSVNVSTRQVRKPGLLEDVQAALASSGLEPSALNLEITETVLAGPRHELIDVLEEVTGLGVMLALDDFGTGYSSLSLLQDLPVHTLKIDRSFVGTIGARRDQLAFVQAIVDLAAALGLTVVGEGLETPAHVAALLGLGCRIGQGFHFAKPLEAHELHELLAGGAVPKLPRVGRTRRPRAAFSLSASGGRFDAAALERDHVGEDVVELS